MSAVVDEDGGASETSPEEGALSSEPADGEGKPAAVEAVTSGPAEVETDADDPAAGVEPADTEGERAAPAEQRFGFVASLAVMVLVIGVVLGGKLYRSLSPRPDESQCAELLDRYIEHKSRQRYPEVKDEAIARAQRTVPDATKRADLDNCRRELSAAQVSCGLRAPNIDEIERCLQ